MRKPRFRVLHLCLVIVALGVCACTGSAATPGPHEFPLVPCRLDVPGAPTAPPEYGIVLPGTIVFTRDAWHNLTPIDRHCGAQAVRGAALTFDLSTFGGEDGITWVATLARPASLASPDPVPPTVSLYRLDAAGPILVSPFIHVDYGSQSEQYRMMGSYGHDARPGSYVMRIVSGDGSLLAEGTFVIVP